jgi:tetratricopeptide (TPR) repeat protein
LINLMKALLELERNAEALVAGEEASGYYRRLTDANPAAYQPKLVISLINCGVVLSALKRHDEALTAVEEAVVISRQLAQISQAVHQMDLVKALGTLGGILAETGRQDEAIAAYREASALYLTSPRTHDSLQTSHSALARVHTAWLRKLVVLCHDVGDRREEATALLQLSQVLYEQAEYEESASVAGWAADIYADAEDHDAGR